MDAAAQDPAAYLPQDLVVEILSRLAAKSLCRFKCVSRSWRAHRRRFAQTLSGFFYCRPDKSTLPLGFASLYPSQPLLDDPSLSFLPSTWGKIELLDSCNGLLLLRCSQETSAGAATGSPPPPFYVVCNPATGEWVALPQPSVEPGLNNNTTKTCSAALGFDPAVSSHFHVFQLVEEDCIPFYGMEEVEIYSSKTGAWTLSGSEFAGTGWPTFAGRTAYFNGFQHFTTWDSVIVSVGVKGQPWRTISVPSRRMASGNRFLGYSQGHLLYMEDKPDSHELGIYVLEDYNRDDWNLKHRVSKETLLWPHKFAWELDHNLVAAVHPSCDRIFFYDRARERLVYYDMNQGRADVICTLREVAHKFRPLLLPHVPFYSRMSTVSQS